MLTRLMARCGCSHVLNPFCHVNIFVYVLSHVTFYNCRHDNGLTCDDSLIQSSNDHRKAPLCGCILWTTWHLPSHIWSSFLALDCIYCIGHVRTKEMVMRASTPNIDPLISIITSFRAILNHIHASCHLSDLLELHLLLQSQLHVMCLCLIFKQCMCTDEEPCLLEQTLCSWASGDSSSFGEGNTKWTHKTSL